MRIKKKILLETALGVGLIFGTCKGACYVGRSFVEGIRGMQDGSQAKREYQIDNYSSAKGYGLKEYCISDAERAKIVESQKNLENSAMIAGIGLSAAFVALMTLRAKLGQDERYGASPSIDGRGAERAQIMTGIYEARKEAGRD